jgi:hypothetical protein
MVHQGSCHCGRVSYEVEGDIDQVLECNCTHCSRKGFLLWFVPRERFRLRSGQDDTTVYTFNKHIIKHHFCKVCGVQPFGLGLDPNGNAMAGINVRTLEDIDLGALKRIPWDGLHS